MAIFGYRPRVGTIRLPTESWIRGCRVFSSKISPRCTYLRWTAGRAISQPTHSRLWWSRAGPLFQLACWFFASGCQAPPSQCTPVQGWWLLRRTSFALSSLDSPMTILMVGTQTCVATYGPQATSWRYSTQATMAVSHAYAHTSEGTACDYSGYLTWTKETTKRFPSQIRGRNTITAASQFPCFQMLCASQPLHQAMSRCGESWVRR